METEIFENGIQLRYTNTEKFTRNNMSVNFIIPLDASAGVTSLLSAVMKHGCKDYPDTKTLSEFLETNYGASFSCAAVKRGESLIFRFAASFPDDSYTDGTPVEDNMLSLMKKMIFEPLVENGSFDDKLVENEKKNQIDSINARINDKTSYANSRCISVMCENEPYATDELGKAEQIEALDGKKLYEQYQKIISNSGVVIFYFGRSKLDKISSWAEKLPLSSNGIYCYPPVRKSPSNEIKRVFEKDSVTQAKAVLGFRMKHDAKCSFAGLTLFNMVFSSSPTSRLFMNVREKLSLCYYCSAVIERKKGIMLVYAGIEAQKLEQLENEILNQLDKLCRRVSKKEIDDAKTALIDLYAQTEDAPSSLESFYLGMLINNGNMTVEDAVRQITEGTSEDIRTAAKAFSLDTIYLLSGEEKTEL